MKRRGLTLMLALLLAYAAGARTAHATLDGGTQSPFALGAGGRSLGMGRTGATGSDDATTAFWNAAGLARLDTGSFSLFRTTLFIDGSSYHAGFLAYPTLDLGTFAIGYQRLDISGIERRDDRNRPLGDFSSAESNLHFGYGRRLGPSVAAGLNVKLATQSIESYSAVGIGFDLGLIGHRSIGRAELHEFRLGVNVQNLIEPTLKLDEVDVTDPRSVKLGAAYVGASQSQSLRWSMAMDLDVPRLADSRVGIGAELSYLNALAIRGGLDDGRLTLGFGLGYGAIRVDYAMFDAETLPRDDRFSVGVRFGHSATARRQDRHQRRQEDVAHRLETLLEQRERDEFTAAMKRAEAASRQQDWQEAAEHYGRARAIDPTNDACAEGLARTQRRQALEAALTLVESGEHARSVVAYQSILERWPDDVEAQAGLDRARREFADVADRERQFEILFRDSLERFAQQDYAESILLLEELLQMSPGHELAATLLERAREASRQMDLAKQVAASKESNPRPSEASSSSTAPTPVLGQSSPSIVSPAPSEGRRGSSRPPDAPTLSQDRRRELSDRYRRGLEEFEHGRFDKATTLWRTIWIEDAGFERVGPYLVQAYLYQSVSLFSEGNYDAALERCDRVLEIEAGNAKALRYRERIIEEQREFARIPRSSSSR